MSKVKTCMVTNVTSPREEELRTLKIQAILKPDDLPFQSILELRKS